MLRAHNPPFLIVKMVKTWEDLVVQAGFVTFLEPVMCPVLEGRIGSALCEPRGLRIWVGVVVVVGRLSKILKLQG